MRFLITAGPTREYLDPIRFFSNKSTGRMGYALSNAAIRHGHEVCLISGPTELMPPESVKFIPVISAADMAQAVKEEFSHADIIIMAAAVADFRPVAIAKEKIKKSDESLSLTLERTEDILKYLGEHRREKQILVGFAAETENLLANAQLKLKRKNLNWIAANLADNGFANTTNIIELINRNGKIFHLELAEKDIIADQIIDIVLNNR